MNKKEILSFSKAALTILNSLSLKNVHVNFIYSTDSSPHLYVYNHDISGCKLFYFWDYEEVEKSQETFNDIFKRLKTDSFDAFSDI